MEVAMLGLSRRAEIMFEDGMMGNWVAVLDACRRDPRLLWERKWDQNILHLALTHHAQLFLVDMLTLVDDLGLLLMMDKLGNSPLHLAAAQGKSSLCENICECWVRLRRQRQGDEDDVFELVSARNEAGETPPFLAASGGHTSAYSYFSRLIKDYDENMIMRIWRRGHGNTVLHSTIASHFFGLALSIVNTFPKLANSVNEVGESPLHVLANQSSAFKSGIHLSNVDNFIYSYFSFKNMNYNPREEVEAMQKRPRQESRAHNRFELPLTAITTRSDFREMSQEVIIDGTLTGTSHVDTIRTLNRKHLAASQLLDVLVRSSSSYEYDADGLKPPGMFEPVELEEDNLLDSDNIMDKSVVSPPIKERPIVIATKMGVTEMVRLVLKTFPSAIDDKSNDGKNLALLAVENRRPHIYQYLLSRNVAPSMLKAVDDNGNSVLHLAAASNESWVIRGAALQMQWETKWFQFVKNSLPRGFVPAANRSNQTPDEIFQETHGRLAKEAGKWLTTTTQNFSVVAALIATVAFATAAAVPGGFDQNKGFPLLKNENLFLVFAMASLVGLASSLTSIILFLTVPTTHYEHYFAIDKLIYGLTFLYISIAAVLVSFCAGHYFIIRDRLPNPNATYIYPIVCLPITYSIIRQLPLYLDLLRSTTTRFPHSGSNRKKSNSQSAARELLVGKFLIERLDE